MVVTYSHDLEKVIFNFSSHELTSSEKHVLSKGLRFAIPLIYLWRQKEGSASKLS